MALAWLSVLLSVLVYAVLNTSCAENPKIPEADCSAGYFLSSSKQCTPCKQGFYRTAVPQSCQQCSDGTTTEVTGAPSAALCNIASAGYQPTRNYQNQVTGVEPCRTGTYSSDGKQCMLCPGGLSTHPAATSVFDCFVPPEWEPYVPGCVSGVWFYQMDANANAIRGPYGGCSMVNSKAPWCMMPAYHGGGTEGVNWMYTSDADDPESLTNWTYYDSSGAVLQTDIQRTTTLSSNKGPWCGLRVYRAGGEEGKQWKYC